MAGLRLFHGGQDLAELADAGGLHQDPVRVIGVDQLVHRGLEVPGQGAADAARVQLGHGDAGVLHEAAVDADLAVFILQQHDLFVPEAAGQQFPDERGLARAQEAGDYIDFYHFSVSFFLYAAPPRKPAAILLYRLLPPLSIVFGGQA